MPATWHRSTERNAGSSVTAATLAAFAVAASIVASGGARKLTAPVADAMAQAALENPILANDERSARVLVAIEVALAWHEGSNQLNPAGSNDGGNSHCWAQVYLPNGARTREGWTGAELRSDPKKCATVAVRLIKASLAASPTCDLCGLVVYARGRDTPEGRRLSAVRMGLARRLLEVEP
jgi:hypothetical protein